MIRPSRGRFLIAEHPLPLSLSLPLPGVDIYDLYRNIVVPGRPSFLLHSGKGPGSTARYSFFGSDPYLTLDGRDGRCHFQRREGTEVREGDPFAILTDLMRSSRIPRPEGLPPFFGGAVAFFSYDLVRRFESLPSHAGKDVPWPDLRALFVDLVAAVDHTTQTLHLMFAPPLERLQNESREKLYREGCDRLGELEARVTSGPNSRRTDTVAVNLTVAPEQSRESYMAQVRRCQELIRAGDIYQANLSHRFVVEGIGMSGLEAQTGHLFQRLRRVNPSPFAALFDCQDLIMISSSPERLVRLDGRRAETRPIAGTRPRGRDLAEDRRLAEELLSNAKERAEHLMLVDLERNDLGRVCRYGTVTVDEFMVVERYSHVSHIVSNVGGELRPECDGFDLIRAVFPGGTITGVPKIRCMQVIEELEPVRRGPYTGSLGYLSWSGDLDLNILIRTLVLSAGRGYVQVGAGIVADSDPGAEYDETLFKAGALIEALRVP